MIDFIIDRILLDPEFYLYFMLPLFFFGFLLFDDTDVMKTHERIGRKTTMGLSLVCLLGMPLSFAVAVFVAYVKN